MSRQPGSLIVLVLLAALALAGPVACGKRGNLEAPKGEPQTWPRPYPAN